MKHQYLADNSMGLEAQRIIGRAVSKQLGFPLEETEDLEDYGKFFQFDWINREKGIFGELKLRRVSRNAYRTTIVGEPKIKYALAHPENTYFFVFRFNDGLFFCHFKDIDTTQKPRLNIAKNGFREWVYDIPIEILKPLHELSFPEEHRDASAVSSPERP